MGLVRVLLVALAPHGADPFIAVVLAFAALRPVVDGASRAPAVAPFLAADGEEAPVPKTFFFAAAFAAAYALAPESSVGAGGAPFAFAGDAASPFVALPSFSPLSS